MAGCSGLGDAQNVFFHPYAYQMEVVPTAEPRLPLFIDNEGNLYPKNGLPSALTERGVDLNRLRDDHDSALRGQSHLCPATRAGTETDQLCQAYPPASSLEGDASRLAAWDAVQFEMWVDRAQTVWDLLEQRDDPTLVVLITGFNTQPDNRPFDAIRGAIDEVMGDDDSLVFLEVNWDGYTLMPFDLAWADAQYSGPLAGFRLRQFFNALDDLAQAADQSMPRVRLFTYSGGAYVAGGLTSNPYYALPYLYNANLRAPVLHHAYREFFSHRAADTGPHRVPQIEDFRISIMAPATSALTFMRGAECADSAPVCRPGVRQPTGLLAGQASLVLSYKPGDRVLTRYTPPGWLSSTLGASGLGADAAEMCRVINQGPLEAEIVAVDFRERNPGFWERWSISSHDWSTYLDHPNAEAVIRAMFSDSLTPIAGQMDCVRSGRYQSLLPRNEASH